MLIQRSRGAGAPFRGKPFASRWVADDEGRWNILAPSLSRSFLHGDVPQGDPVARTLSYTGDVAVSIETGEPVVIWSVRRANSASIAAALQWLSEDFRHSRIRLTYYFDGWQSEVHFGIAAVAARMMALEHHRDFPLARRVFRRPASSSEFDRTSGKRLRGFYAQWERAGGRLDDDRLAAFLPYLLVYRPEEGSGLLRIDHIGEKSACAAILGTHWARTAPGGYYNYDLPSAEYSDTVSGAYACALDQRAPQFDEINASMDRAHAQPRWASYRRLVVPGRARRGQEVILVYSEFTGRPSLPFPAA